LALWMADLSAAPVCDSSTVTVKACTHKTPKRAATGREFRQIPWTLEVY
jgi:hypothetical protein